METRREQIIKLLKGSDGFISAEQIAYSLDIRDVGLIYNDIQHIAKTIKGLSGGRETIIMDPPKCRKCGFIFKNTKHLKKPGRCPKCRSTWIEPAKFKIVYKKR
jgi:hypothetical protein